jgi:hypothetical protein
MKLEYVVLKSNRDEWHVLLSSGASKAKSLIIASWFPPNIGYRVDHFLYEQADWQVVDLLEKSNESIIP